MSTNTAKHDYDLLVIGGGSGGLAAARQAASLGAKVAIAEQTALGGTCVNRGCIAKRLMVYAADFSRQFETAKSYGWSLGQPQFDWSAFVAAMHRYTQQLSQSAAENLEKLGVDIFGDRATLTDAHTVQLGDRSVTADKMLIAVGGQPVLPDISGIELALTSDQMFHLPQIPQQLTVIGGGYIGVEFASIMRGLGCEVTMMDTNDRILKGFDLDIRDAVQQGLAQRGIQFLPETSVKELERRSEQIQLTLSGASCPATLTADVVLCAIGRQPNLKNLGLEKAGVELKDGAVQVDASSRTTQANIFAVGDCTDRIQLTPVARAEGRAVAAMLFGDRSQSINNQSVNYQWVPSAVCARPEAASIGLSEDQARQQCGDSIECYRSEFQPLFHALSGSGEKALLKLVIDSSSDKVLGVHMVGDRAAEIVQTLAIAVKTGLTREQLQNTIGIHPTEGEEVYSL